MFPMEKVPDLPDTPEANSYHRRDSAATLKDLGFTVSQMLLKSPALSLKTESYTSFRQ
jgi:hypothetical protein